jgi:long-subunit acyl-CoA synthetase (AMP-forming)
MSDRDTVIDVLVTTAEAHADRLALRHRRENGWADLTWAEYREQVFRAARALMALGVGPSSCVVILGGNRPEWFIVDLATIAAGGLPSGIYTTSTPEQCGYIIRHCDAVVAVVENPGHLDRLASVRDRLGTVVVMEGGEDEEGVIGWDAFLALGDEVPRADLDARIASLSSGDPCTLIYTSGTTGEPKGVMLSHDNVLWVSRAMVKQYAVTEEDCGISYLPLSHIAEQIISLYLPLVVGGCMSFARSLETLGDDLRLVRPTFFFAVPRVWEKIQARMEAAGAQAGPVRRRLVQWAREVGLVGGRASQRGEPLPWGWRLAKRLVFDSVRRRLGFDRTRVFFTSAAPMARSTLDFFLSLGIPILEVYGMSECTGPTTFSTETRYRTGSAGWAIPGTELKIADDGEILYRGPHVFVGYFRDEAATREAVDEDGWLHSGDVGMLDEEGFLYVTDRKKELIITSGGKNIAPVPIESKLKSIKGVAQAVVVGDRRKYLSVLILLDPEAIEDLARELGSAAVNVQAAAGCDRFQEYFGDRIDAVNATLAPYESVKRFALLSEGLSVEDNTLTPTLKLKRRVIHEVFAETIDELYQEG